MACKNCACPAWEWNLDRNIPKARISVCPVCGRVGRIVTSRCVRCELEDCPVLENDVWAYGWNPTYQNVSNESYDSYGKNLW